MTPGQRFRDALRDERPLQIAAAGMIVVAILPWLTGIRTRIDPHDQPLRHLRLLLQTPLLFAPALTFGVIDGGFMELMNVYLLTRDLTVASASTIAFCGVLGALLLIFPGWISDLVGLGLLGVVLVSQRLRRTPLKREAVL